MRFLEVSESLSGHFHCCSETRLLRTLKGNEKTYVVTKVRSTHNAIFLTCRAGSTCSRERSATEDAFSVLNVVHYSLFVRWNRLSGHRELENVPEFEIETQLFVDMLVIRWKLNQRKGKRVLLEGKLVRNIRFCATFCTSYPKKLTCFPIGDVRDRRRKRYNRVYVLSRVRNNRVSLYMYSETRLLRTLKGNEKRWT